MVKTLPPFAYHESGEDYMPDYTRSQASEFLDWLASEHCSQEDQQRFPELVRIYGYALPAPIWAVIEEEMAQWLQDEIESAESRAGWDPNP